MVSREGVGVMVNAAITVTFFETEAAGAYVALPDCEAWMVQVPACSSVAVLPETLQRVGMSDVKLTGRPEVAVAVSVRIVPCRSELGSALKVMVCVCLITVTLCEVVAAA
jgi:hypothetical protein